MAMDDDDRILCPRCHRGSVRRLAKKTAMRVFRLPPSLQHQRIGPAGDGARRCRLASIRQMQKAGFTCDQTCAPTHLSARVPAGAEDRVAAVRPALARCHATADNEEGTRYQFCLDRS
jgi:hypothetical protein